MAQAPRSAGWACSCWRCEFCIKNDELYIKYDEFCTNNDEFYIKNDGFCIKNDEFRFNDDGFNRRRRLFQLIIALGMPLPRSWKQRQGGGDLGLN